MLIPDSAVDVLVSCVTLLDPASVENLELAAESFFCKLSLSENPTNVKEFSPPVTVEGERMSGDKKPGFVGSG